MKTPRDSARQAEIVVLGYAGSECTPVRARIDDAIAKAAQHVAAGVLRLVGAVGWP